MFTNFISNTSNITNTTTFYIISDNSTVVSLIQSITSNCSSSLNTSPSPSPLPFNGTFPGPVPEEVVQYYRASSVALALDGYNNSAAFSQGNGTDDAMSPLPQGVDTQLLGCLNATIGEGVPLVDANGGVRGMVSRGAGNVALVQLLLVWVMLFVA
jgi:hypothetical protein